MQFATSRLSSGVALQRAADNPGKLGAGIRFATQVLSTRMAMRNITSGQSLLHVADAALGEVSNLLQQARQLAVSAANGILSDSERAFFHQELAGIRQAINQTTDQTIYNGRRVFGTYGQGGATLHQDLFNNASGISGFVDSIWQSDRIALGFTTANRFADSFDDLSRVAGATTTAAVSGGKAVSSRAMAAALTDTFATLSRVDAGLTTALVDTIGGLVRLSQTVTLRGSDTFTATGGYVTQGVSAASLWGDTFADLSGVDGALTTALISGGQALLPTAFGTALAGNPGWQLSQVLNQQFFDTFAATGGQVESGSSTATLWSATPSFQLPGSVPGWITSGSDTFGDLTQVAASTGLDINTIAGTVQLLTETFTVGSDSFGDLTRIDTGNTTANVDPATGTVKLNTTAITESFSDTFTDTSRVLSSAGVDVDTATGAVTLGSITPSVAIDTFADDTGLGAASTGVVVSGGQLQLDQTLQTTSAQGAAIGINPGTGGNGQFDSIGVLASSVVDLGGGKLGMYYVTSRGNGNSPTVGYTESLDGGLSWGTGNNLSIAGVNASSEIYVTRNSATGTFYMFYSDGNNIYQRASTTGTGGWSAATTVTNRGSYSYIGDMTIAKDAGGTYAMFVEVTNGGVKQIEKLTATSLSGPWSQDGSWVNMGGEGPEIVDEGNRYSLYYRDTSTGNIVRRTSLDLNTFSAVTDVITRSSSGFGTTIDTGGAVYDAATGVTRMIYRGLTTAGEYATSMAYTTQRTAGTFISTLSTTASATQNLTLNATADTSSGTISYEVSADNGTTWQAITSGGSIAVASGTQVLLRSTLTNTLGIGGGGPTLQDFTLTTQQYGAVGTLTSTAHSFTQPVDSFTLTPGATTPAGTSIGYEYSSDGGATWTAFTAGSQVNLGATASALQVRANLTTSDSSVTPTLSDYTLTGSSQQYAAAEYLYTQNYTFGDSINAFDLSAAQSGSAAWEYSADGGTTWQAAAPGANTLAGPVSQLKLRARLDAGGGGTTTPVISDYSVTAIRYQSTGTFTSQDYTFASPVDQIRLTTTETAPGGSSINHEISTDGGTTWQAISSGGTVSLGSAATSVKLRTTLGSTDQYYTPTLSDYSLEGYTTGYSPAETYTSAVYNFGYDVQNVTLNVTESKPAGTAITYALSTDGGATWQAIAAGSGIAVTPGQNLMLRANLSSSDPGLTPQLLSYSLTSDQKQASTVWQSTVTSLGADAGAVKLTAAESLPAGTSIAYEVSADGGANWTSVTPGTITNLGAAGSQLVARATLTSADPYATAALQELKLETYDYQTSGTFTSGLQTLSAATTQVRLDNASTVLPAGTGATYAVTNDGGATWQAVAPGATATFATAGAQVGFRATLTGDGSATPTVGAFALAVPGYESGHYVYSTVHSLGSAIDNITLTTAENRPAGTTISYEVSTDGGTAWTAVTAGANTLVPSGSAVLLRAYLASGDAGLTPQLLDYSLQTNQPSGSEWYSTVYSTGSNVSQVRLNVSENKPGGTDIAYQLSTDGGVTWQAIDPGSFSSVAPGQDLVLKAMFSSANPAAAVAQLLDYTLQTRDYNGPATFTSTASDIGHDVTELQLDVNANTAAGTGIAYELSNDGGATWVAATPGAVTSFTTAGSQIAMRATLTGSNTATPELHDYSVKAPIYQTSVLSATPQTLGAPLTNVTLDATATTPSGTGIIYELSADNGANWQTITPGLNTALAHPGTQLLMRATLTSADGRSTAELLDWRLDTQLYKTSGSFVTTAITLPSATNRLRLMANTLLNGGTIDFELSGDGGATWVAATPGSEAAFASATNQVLMRASFSGTGDASPHLLDFRLEGESDSAPVANHVSILTGPNGRATVQLSLPWITAASLGIDALDLTSMDGARAAQVQLDQALNHVLRARVEVGATANSLEHELNRQSAYEAAMEGARSNLMDADMAYESLNYVRANLLYKSGSQLMAAGLNGRREAISTLLGPLPAGPWAPTAVPSR